MRQLDLFDTSTLPAAPGRPFSQTPLDEMTRCFQAGVWVGKEIGYAMRMLDVDVLWCEVVNGKRCAICLGNHPTYSCQEVELPYRNWLEWLPWDNWQGGAQEVEDRMKDYSAKVLALRAAKVILAGDFSPEVQRAYDACFEMYTGKEVVGWLSKWVREDPILRHAVTQHKRYIPTQVVNAASGDIGLWHTLAFSHTKHKKGE
jgi:hypothetical protein